MAFAIGIAANAVEKAPHSGRKGLYWSYPPHDRMMGVPTSKVRNLFFYGKHGVMYNTGTSHRRARKNSERGYTLCEGFIKPSTDLLFRPIGKCPVGGILALRLVETFSAAACRCHSALGACRRHYVEGR